MVRMELSKLVITETSDYQVVWLKEKGGDRTFPILIGIVEAAAIDRNLREIPTPRPLTHDLMAQMVTGLGGILDRVTISGLQNNTFFAKLVIKLNGRNYEIDSRPSDAIAMAVRLKSDIYVDDEVLNNVCSDLKEGEDAPPEQA